MRIVPVFLAVLLLAPLAAAHLPHRRSSIQASEGERVVSVEASGTRAFVNLTLAWDIERDAVSHVVDPRAGLVALSYRASPPDSSTRFEQRWTIDRLLEYHDANQNGRYEPNVDGPVRSWRFSSYAWSPAIVASGAVGTVAAKTASWVGTLQGGPNVTLQMAVAGKPLTDEGANARSQDIILYLTLSSFPARALGDLYVLETTVTTRGSANLTEDRTQGLTTDVRLMQDTRAGYVDWGATALTDNQETSMLVNIGDPTIQNGEESRALRFDLARFDRTLRLVVVSAVEYDNSALQTTPDVGVAAVVLVLAAMGVSGRVIRRAR